MNLSKTKSRCLSCGVRFFDEDARSVCVFAQTEAEPAEYEIHCPVCNSVKIEPVSIALCRTCDDAIVGDFGEQCAECNACEREALFDAMMGH